MLKQYFEFVQQHLQYLLIHWNMRDSNYGFFAIENRFSVLGGAPISILDGKKIDLSRLLVNCYGRNYIGHPRLEKLIDKNRMTKKDFLNGAEEAEAFENKRYIKLRSSTLRKIDLFSSIIHAAANDTLETNSTFKGKYGISLQGIYEALKEKWWFKLIIFFVGIALGAIISQ
jgi:hypothetical protein